MARFLSWRLVPLLAVVPAFLHMLDAEAAARRRGRVVDPRVVAESDLRAARLVRLEAEVTAAEDIAAIKRLQRTYGYFVDKGLWADAAEYFTDDAAMHSPAGVVQGKEDIRQFLLRNRGDAPTGLLGLGDGRLHNHLNLQPVIHLEAGGQGAQGRWRVLAQVGSFGRSASWAEGVQVLRYVKQRGVWKIREIRYTGSFDSPFATGWAASAAGQPAAGDCAGFAPPCIAPFHYANPGTPPGGAAWRIDGLPLPPRVAPALLPRKVAQLQRRVARLRDEQQIENLLRSYGYYLDRAQWDQVTDLFADEASLEMDQRGVYVGRQRIRQFLGTLAPEGLRAGLLFDHLHLQTVVTVAADGRTAAARSRQFAMTGEAGGRGTWSEGIYESRFVQQEGVWKFRSLHYYPTFITDAAKGWALDAQEAPGIDPGLPPDRPPSQVYPIYPRAHIPPFHYRNPVTGLWPEYPTEGKPAMEALLASRFEPGRAPLQVPRDTDAALAESASLLARIKDHHEIENLQSAYGYYLDKNLWSELSQLFARDGSIELAERGVYRGARLREFLVKVFGRGEEGPVAGRLGNHIQLQPVIHVDDDGRRARVRVRMLQQMSQGARASVGAAVYENELVKEDGVWKFAVVNAYNTLSAVYVGGWAQAASRGMPGRSVAFPPDGPPTREVAMFPILRDMPYHYANPVTGRTQLAPLPPLAQQMQQYPLPPPPAPPPPVVEPLRPSGMPAAVAEGLRKIGPRIDGAATAALYAPLHAGTPAMTVQRDLAYGPHERHRLDLFRTAKPHGEEQGLRPVLVFIHGGGFSRGAKSAEGSPFYDNVGQWAARQGLLGITINYRLAPQHPYPAGAQDLQRLLSWLKSAVRAHGGDPRHVVLWGHSAGAAHVADYLVREPRGPVSGAVLTSGIYTLGPGVSIWKDYYGEDTARYMALQSLERLAKVPVPLLVNHAELDPPAFVADSIALVQARAAAGTPTRHLRLPAHSHVSETYAVGTPDESLSVPVLDFIRSVAPSRRRP